MYKGIFKKVKKEKDMFLPTAVCRGWVLFYVNQETSTTLVHDKVKEVETDA